MADKQVAVIVVQMHTVPFAVTKHLAAGTFSATRPLTVAIRTKSVLPNIDKPVFVNIALMEIGTNARTARNRTVRQDRSRRNACAAFVEMIAHIHLVMS